VRSAPIVVGTVILAICLPVLAFATVSLSLVFDPSFYSRGQVEQQVERTYGLPQSLLVPANRAIVQYFASQSGPLADYFQANGVPRDFFGERETVHMEDVRNLVHLIERLRSVAMAAGLLVVALMALFLRRHAVIAVGRALIAGVVLSLVVVLVIGVSTLIDFNTVFLLFHLLSFSNSFWILDPRTDHLIQMFPFGFWYNAMITIIVWSLATIAVCGVVGVLMVRAGRRWA
jgi:integral membrane protein (TIGR01906 family)